MRFSVRLAAMTAVCTLPATIALAQGQESGTSASMGERSPDQVTCADITAMDTRLVPGVLYFISGYQEGSRAGMTGAGGGQAASGAASDLTTITGGSETVGDAGSASGSAMPDTGSASGGTSDQASASGNATTSSATSGSDTATSGSGGSAAAMSGTDPSSTGGSPATASNGNAASSSGDAASATTGGSGASSGDQASAGGSGSGGSMNVMRVTGMFEIPVEQVMVVCGQSPDMKASDAVEQNRGSSGSTN